MIVKSLEARTSLARRDSVNRFKYEVRNINRERDNPDPLEEPSIRLLDHWHDKTTLTVCPPHCVVENLWPSSKRKASEREMFRDTNDRFGMPKVICSYEVFYAKHGDHSFSVPDGANYYNVFGGNGHKLVSTAPEPRTHIRSIFETVGGRLEGAKGPKHLATAILHAMIGWYPSIIRPSLFVL